MIGQLPVPTDTIGPIMKLLGDTEKVLLDITGLHIRLRMEICREYIEAMEAQWLLLQQTICEVTGFSWAQIVKRCRKRDLVLARQAYCWYGRKYIGGRGTHKIGRDLGGLNHTTVITSTATFSDLLESRNPAATELLKQIQKRLNYETKTNPAAV